MSKLLIFVSATIVVIFSSLCWASPQSEAPQSQSQEDSWPDSKPDENLSISTPPEVSPTAKTLSPHLSGYYPYRQALTFRFGQFSKFAETKPDEFIFGFQYLFPKFLSPKLEAGADVHEDGRGHIHAGWRWFFWERTHFRPSYKISLDHLAVAEDNLATFTKLDHYYARVSGTLEYVFRNPWSARLEAEVLAGFENQKLALSLGISRGW